MDQNLRDESVVLQTREDESGGPVVAFLFAGFCLVVLFIA